MLNCVSLDLHSVSIGVEVVVEVFELLLIGAIIKIRHDCYEKHGVFMPSEQFILVELCDKVLHTTQFHPDF